MILRFSASTIAFTLALPAALLAGAACSGRTTNASSATVLDGDVTRVREAGAAVWVLDGGAPSLDAAWKATAADAASPWNDDATVPETVDASCGDFTIALDPDATPNTCELSPADVACNVASDCTMMLVGHCSCFTQVYGVSTTSTASCPMPPCTPPPPPPGGGGGCSESGFETQDCNKVPAYGGMGVACIEHRCLTFAAIEH